MSLSAPARSVALHTRVRLLSAPSRMMPCILIRPPRRAAYAPSGGQRRGRYQSELAERSCPRWRRPGSSPRHVAQARPQEADSNMRRSEARGSSRGAPDRAFAGGDPRDPRGTVVHSRVGPSGRPTIRPNRRWSRSECRRRGRPRTSGRVWCGLALEGHVTGAEGSQSLGVFARHSPNQAVPVDLQQGAAQGAPATGVTRLTREWSERPVR